MRSASEKARVRHAKAVDDVAAARSMSLTQMDTAGVAAAAAAAAASIIPSTPPVAAPSAPAPPPDSAAAAHLTEHLMTRAYQRLMLARRPMHVLAADAAAERSRPLPDGEKPPKYKRARIPPSLQQKSSVDIIQKGMGGSATKRKLLVLLPFRFSCTASNQQLGWMSQLNTNNPTMYINFKEGRIKLFGTYINCSNPFLTLQLNKKKARANGAHHQPPPLQVKGIFQTICAFTEWRWIGSAAENPDEHSMPLPHSIHVEQAKSNTSRPFAHGDSLPQSSGSGSQHEGQDDGGVDGGVDEDDEDDTAGIIDLVDDDDDDAEEDESEDVDRKRRASGHKRTLSSLSTLDEDESEDAAAVPSSSAKRRKHTARSKSREWDGENDESEEDDDGDEVSTPAASQSSMTSISSSRPRRQSTSRQINYAVDLIDERFDEKDAESEEEDENDDDGGEEDDE